MAQAVRRKWNKTLPDGTRVSNQSRKWYAEYTDAAGERQRVPGYTDKAATEQLAARLERESARGKEGLTDPSAAQKKRPLVDHLDDYAAILTAQGDVKEHVKETTAKVRRLLAGCGFKTIGDVDAGKAATWLTDRQRSTPVPELPRGVEWFRAAEAAAVIGVKPESFRSAVTRHLLPSTGRTSARRYPRATVQALADRMGKGIGPTTFNAYVTALRGFFLWMVEEGRAPADPLRSLRHVNAKVDVRRGRRELPADELGRLFTAAKNSREVFRTLTGPDRYHLYLVAATTGFRAAALAGLTPADFNLPACVVTLPARFNKSGKVKPQPIPADVAELLKGYLAGKPRTKPVWGGTWSKQHRGAQMIRVDLRAAGIPYSVPGPDGPEYADFHALRHSYLTLGGRSGIDLRTLQELAGHASLKQTERYSHRRLHDLAGAVGRLPSLIPVDPPVDPN